MSKKQAKIKPEFYYYKTEDGKGWLKDRVPHAGYIEITEQEWNTHVASLHHEPTAAQLAKQAKKREIVELKSYLSKTDYCVIKIAEGVATAEEYAEVLTERAAARARINELEGELE